MAFEATDDERELALSLGWFDGGCNHWQKEGVAYIRKEEREIDPILGSGFWELCLWDNWPRAIYVTSLKFAIHTAEQCFKLKLDKGERP